MVQFNDTTAKRIGDEIGIDWNEIDIEEFNKGLNVELEHGTRYHETNVTNDDLHLTAKITWAHLKEFPDYYTRLDEMENEAKLFWRGFSELK